MIRFFALFAFVIAGLSVISTWVDLPDSDDITSIGKKWLFVFDVVNDQGMILLIVFGFWFAVVFGFLTALWLFHDRG